MTNTPNQPAAAPSAELPRHTRPQPPEWTALHELATESLAASPVPGLIPFRDLRTIVRGIKDLDDETLARNRYYGLGVVTCQFSQTLAVPEHRAMVVENAGASLASRVKRSSKDLRLNDLLKLLNSQLNSATDDLIPIVDAKLYPADRIVADSLAGVFSQRFYRMRHRPFKAWRTEKYLANRRPWLATTQVSNNSLAGAAGIVWQALRVKAAHDGLLATDENPALATIATQAELAELDLDTAGRTIAGLHIDELDIPKLKRVLVDDGTGKLAVDRAAIGTFSPSAIIKPVTSLHTDRLRCPALQVAGAIPQVLELFPDIIMAAERRVHRRR